MPLSDCILSQPGCPDCGRDKAVSPWGAGNYSGEPGVFAAGSFKDAIAEPRFCLARHGYARFAFGSFRFCGSDRETPGPETGLSEGIAYRKGWISEEKMREVAAPMLKNQYGQYLLKVIEELKS